MTHREINSMMIARIRGATAQPYTEGEHVLRVVHVTGRASGTDRPFPIAVTQRDGRRYVCAPNRQRDWVRNLLAAGECRIEGDPADRYRTVLVEDADEAAATIALYLGGLDRQTTMWPFAPGAPVETIRRYADEVAVFRLEEY
jgi:hypothetical protein